MRLRLQGRGGHWSKTNLVNTDRLIMLSISTRRAQSERQSDRNPRITYHLCHLSKILVAWSSGRLAFGEDTGPAHREACKW